MIKILIYFVVQYLIDVCFNGADVWVICIVSLIVGAALIGWVFQPGKPASSEAVSSPESQTESQESG